MNFKNSQNITNSWQLKDESHNFFGSQEDFSIKCPTHPRYQLTNICMSPGCIEPLCPECFKHHLKLHTEIQSPCSSETLISMRDICQNTVQNLLNDLLKEKQKLNDWQDERIMPQEQSIIKIRQAKDKLFNMINKFFESIERNLNESVAAFKASHQEDFDHLSHKINLWIEDLQNSQVELNGSDYIKCMLKVFL